MMVNESERNGPVFGRVTMLSEMAFDLAPDSPQPSPLGKTHAPVNQLPELTWDCSTPVRETRS